MNEKPRIKNATKRKLIIAAIIVLILIALLAGTVLIALNGRFLKSNPETGSGDGRLDSDIITPAEIKKKNVNVLVVGIDGNTEREEQHFGKRTDTIMVVSYNLEEQKVNVLQIPRDTFVGDEVSTGKINEVYGKNGGIEGLAKQINKMFNITLDHYMTVNMDGFITIIDKIGGVEVDVPHDMQLDDVFVKKGLQVLNGTLAQVFVRNRNYAMADIKRMEMQKIFIQSLFKKVMSLKYSDILAIAPTVIKEMNTDLNLAELLGYYKKGTELNIDKIKFHQLPIERAIYNKLEVLNVNKEKTAKLLNDNFRTFTSPVAASELDIKSAKPQK